MKLPKIYWFTYSKQHIKLVHIHTGFNDYCLLWINNLVLMDLFFFQFNFKFKDFTWLNLKCWFLRKRYGSQCLYLKYLAFGTLLRPLKYGKDYYVYIGKGYYLKTTQKYDL